MPITDRTGSMVFLVLLATTLLLPGCRTAIPEQATGLGMATESLQGNPFRHRVFRLAASDDTDSHDRTTIILVDGDGHPFLDPTTIASDPTQAISSLLDLAPTMAQLGKVIYLGRPCYHRLEDPQCNPLYWTLARYGPDVVASSVAVARRLAQAGDRVFLVGYSGGGVIAMLMAGRMPDRVSGVVTYGAPLDIAAWTTYHGYTPLSLSENPADVTGNFSGFCQRHLFGDRDTVVPVALVRSWRWPALDREFVTAADHLCCWQDAVVEALRVQVGNCP